MRKRITKVCHACGSENVVMNAWVTWNTGPQEWQLYDVFPEDQYCRTCEETTVIVDKELPPPLKHYTKKDVADEIKWLKNKANNSTVSATKGHLFFAAELVAEHLKHLDDIGD